MALARHIPQSSSSVGEREVIGPVRLGETFGENTWTQHVWKAPVSESDAAMNSAAGRMERERPGALLARRTRTVKLCSFDARSKGQPSATPFKRGVRRRKTLARINGTSREIDCEAIGG